MSETLDERLTLAADKLRRKRKLEGMLRDAQQELRELNVRKANLAEQLEKERLDVAALHGMTLTAMFHWAIGRKEEKIDKERQELVAAQVKFDAARKSASAQERNCQEYRTMIAELGCVESEHERLLEEKRRLVLVRGGDAAVGLAKLDDALSQKDGVIKELKEAIVAGEAAIDALDMVRSSLGSARSLGNWDMFSGRMWTSMAKHSQLDDAQRRAMIAQEKLRRFRAELADAGRRLEVSLRVDGFTRFADIFFDNLITDWFVQDQIYRAMDSCNRAIDEVRAALRECRRRMEETAQETARMMERRKEWIVQG